MSHQLGDFQADVDDFPYDFLIVVFIPFVAHAHVFPVHLFPQPAQS
jgi:hypothetical protein